MADFSTLPPNTTLNVQPFKAHIPDQKLDDFKQLLKLSPIAPVTFENTHADRTFGTQRDWLINAKEYWLNTFDWRQHEDRFNSFPQFTAPVTDSDGNDLTIHFLALFSQRSDAVPLAFFHGWPGSFVEFLDLLSLLREKYTPENLPYHIIVPSLPGYAWSSVPSDKDYSTELASSALHALLIGLGFRASGYLVQGGDIGSFVSRFLAEGYDECKGMHLNMLANPPPTNRSSLPITEEEISGIQRGRDFFDTGFGYNLEQGTRTSTIGLALSSSPLALLAWVGEKFLEWTDEDPPLDKILEDVTLYWLTDTYPRCIYPYRGQSSTPSGQGPRRLTLSGVQNRKPEDVKFVNKPCGYSWFPKEIFPAPRSWAGEFMNVVSFGRHEGGGHFAAMEKPAELLADVEEWVGKAWKTGDGNGKGDTKL